MFDFMMGNWDKFFTVFFAWLSAIFAIISSWLLWLEYRRNNPKIEVKMGFAIAWVWWWVELVSISAENHGRRKVVISSWYFQDSQWKKLIFFYDSDVYFHVQNFSFPITIDEQWVIQILLNKAILEDSIKEQNFRIRKLCFSDTLWNIYSYKLSSKNRKALLGQ